MPLQEIYFNWILSGSSSVIIKVEGSGKAAKDEAIAKFLNAKSRLNPNNLVPDAFLIEESSIIVKPTGSHLFLNPDEVEVIE